MTTTEIVWFWPLLFGFTAFWYGMLVYKDRNRKVKNLIQKIDAFGKKHALFAVRAVLVAALGAMVYVAIGATHGWFM